MLVTVQLDGAPSGLSNLVISGNIGQQLAFVYDGNSSGGVVCDCDGNVLDECGVRLNKV